MLIDRWRRLGFCQSTQCHVWVYEWQKPAWTCTPSSPSSALLYTSCSREHFKNNPSYSFIFDSDVLCCFCCAERRCSVIFYFFFTPAKFPCPSAASCGSQTSSGDIDKGRLFTLIWCNANISHYHQGETCENNLQRVPSGWMSSLNGCACGQSQNGTSQVGQASATLKRRWRRSFEGRATESENRIGHAAGSDRFIYLFCSWFIFMTRSRIRGKKQSFCLKIIFSCWLRGRTFMQMQTCGQPPPLPPPFLSLRWAKYVHQMKWFSRR